MRTYTKTEIDTFEQAYEILFNAHLIDRPMDAAEVAANIGEIQSGASLLWRRAFITLDEYSLYMHAIEIAAAEASPKVEVPIELIHRANYWIAVLQANMATAARQAEADNDMPKAMHIWSERAKLFAFQAMMLKKTDLYY